MSASAVVMVYCPHCSSLLTVEARVEMVMTDPLAGTTVTFADAHNVHTCVRSK